MILNELNLIGFGKFENKSIKLSNGLNIVYGQNEDGKTTIHSFIDGMFYGFLRPNVKRALYTAQHDKYNPWNTSRYAGIIKFTYNGIDYRIERTFTRGEESTHVFLEDTGEDITNTIDTGDSGRILQPGFHFFGFNNGVYANTLSIKQLGSITEEGLANEVRDKLVNVSTSLDENVSVDRAIKELDKSIKEIGSIRAGKSPYGLANEELRELEEEKHRILNLKGKYDDLMEKESILEEGLKNREDDLEKIRLRLNDVRMMEKANLLEEGKLLNKRISELQGDLRKNEIYKDLSMEDYSKGIDLENTIKHLKIEEERQRSRLEEIHNKLEETSHVDIGDLEKDKAIELDYAKYEDLEEEKTNIFYSGNAKDTGYLEKDYGDNARKKKNYTLGLILSIILGLGIIVLSLGIKKYLFSALSLIFIPFGIYCFNKLKSTTGLVNRISSQIEGTKKEKQLDNIRLEEINKAQESILEKYELGSKLDLKRIYDNIQISQYNKDSLEKRNSEEKEKELLTLDRINNLEDQLKEATKNLQDILKDNRATDLEDFRIGLSKKSIYDEGQSELKSKEEILRRILGDLSLEAIEKELQESGKDYSNMEELKSKEELASIMDSIIEDINHMKINKKGVEENLKTLNKDISRLVIIDEDIERKKELIDEFNKKIESLTLAKDTIDNISKDIHVQFAPAINQKVGDIMARITRGKYNSVRIDSELGIGVQDPTTNEIIDIDSLSGGTIDQLYFSLRYGIINSISQEELPLILDDCFVQYDNNRLEGMLKLLSKISQEKQVILFTCHSREIEILEELGMNFNLISLS